MSKASQICARKVLTMSQVIARVRHKAAVFGQDYGQQHEADDKSLKINPGLVADLFEHWVMPLTKEVEVQYLLRRLEWDG